MKLLVLGLLVGVLEAQQPDVKVRIQTALQAWTAAQSAQNREQVARTYGPFDDVFRKAVLADGEDFQKKGEYARALERYYFGVDLAGSAGDNLRSSVGWQLIGGIERLQAKYAESEAHYRKALEYALLPGAKERYVLVLNNLAGLFVGQARYAEGMEILQNVIEQDERDGITSDAAPWQNLAIIYGLQGDMARSLDHFLKALKIYERVNDTRKIALTHYNIGILQIKQANFEAAAQELETARALNQKSGDKTQIAQVTGDLGRVRDAQNRPVEALGLMNQALDLCKEIGFRVGYVDTLDNLANFHLAHGELDLAAGRFEEARKVATEELHDGYTLGISLRGLGLIARQKSDFALASRYAGEALENARRIGDIQGEWQAEALEGMARRALGNREQSRNAFSRAIALIERERGMVAGGDVEKQRFFEQAVYPYQQLAGLEADGGNWLGALQAAERARSRVLLDILAAGPEQIDRLMTEEERKQEKGLRAQMSSINARLSRAKPGEEQGVMKVRDEAWHSYESFLAALYLRHPDLRAWRGESPVVGEAELAALLPDSGTAMIEYLSSAEETLMFVVVRDTATGKVRVAAHRIGAGRAKLEKQADAFRALLEARDPGFRAAARALQDLLVKPAAAELKGKTRIYLVPDGPLWGLPFQALVSASNRYWIEDATLSYAPSLTFLRDQALQNTGKPGAFQSELFALGDPARKESPSIPALRQQVTKIGALYEQDSKRVVVRLGAQADEAAFKASAPAARVIHVAAHGMVDGGNALHSRVMLAAAGNSGKLEDGWLEAWELMRMSLNADLVVLSACETGRGRAAEGEGLVGLTWALFVSGVRTAVVSQWRVESESTTELMVGLHRRLRKGEQPAQALRGSVLSLMKDARYGHPMYWAAFVSAGLR
jgi:CHAT domain-containing protein